MGTRSLFLVALCLMFASPVLAKETKNTKDDASLTASVRTGCEKEIGSYCPSITPGEGRVLSCLYSYEDKLSPRCEYALYDAAAQLERVVAALAYVSSECGADMETHCAATKPGEGRMLECLKKADKELSERCRVALQDVRRR